MTTWGVTVVSLFRTVPRWRTRLRAMGFRSSAIRIAARLIRKERAAVAIRGGELYALTSAGSLLLDRVAP